MAGNFLSDVPKFSIKNNLTDADLNTQSWRHLYRMDDSPDRPNNGDPNIGTQLPWLTLYKTHNDLLQIKLVTTIGYVEVDHGNNQQSPALGNTGDASKFEATFIKGFPLLLQNSFGQATSEDWENGWAFYQNSKVQSDFSGNLDSSFGGQGWLGPSGSGTNKVIAGIKSNRNLIIIDLDSDDFILKGQDVTTKFSGNSSPFTYNNKERPKYLVVRLDGAVEESAIGYQDTISGLVWNNSNTWTDANIANNPQRYVNSTDDGPTLGAQDMQFGSAFASTGRRFHVFNYVYSGYVISPYDFMAAFTTDYLRGLVQVGQIDVRYILIHQLVHQILYRLIVDFIAQRVN